MVPAVALVVVRPVVLDVVADAVAAVVVRHERY